MLKRFVSCTTVIALLFTWGITGYGGKILVLLADALTVSASAEKSGSFIYYVNEDESSAYYGMVQIASYTGTSTDVTIPNTIGGRTVYLVSFSLNGDGFPIDRYYAAFDSAAAKAISRGFKSFSPSLNSNTEFRYTFDDTGNVKELEVSAYDKSINSATIPEGVTRIGDWAFSDCSNLSSITIPEGVTTIGGSAFRYCSMLSDVTLPTSLRSIGNVAFDACPVLEEIVIPDGVTEIGTTAFHDCPARLYVGCVSIGLDWAINKGYNDASVAEDDGKSYVIEHRHIEIDGAVSPSCTETGLTEGNHCKDCEAVIIPQETVAALGHSWNEPSYTWADNSATVTATRVCARDAMHKQTERAVTTWELIVSPTETNGGKRLYTSDVYRNGAFVAQTKTMTDVPALNTLNGMILPIALTIIDEEAFICGAFEYVIVPETCSEIGARAFANCQNLVYIRIPASVTSIAVDAFDGCGENLIIDRLG